ncbi:MAG: hypothetical protein PHW34_00900 [Hespellia sp.]|nr:hypothetical protein [Hespellia sp.]
MEDKLLFGVFPSSLIFITTKLEKPFINKPELYMMNNGEGEVEFQNEAGLTTEDELPRIDETERRPEWETLSRIYVEFFWGTGEGCLSSKERGAAITPSWVKGEKQWYIKYDKGGGYFIIIPGATVKLKQRYSVSFLFDNLISDAIPGMTTMCLYVQNVPGVKDFSVSIPLYKEEPLEIVRFSADDAVVKKKGTTTLRWEVKASDQQSLSNFGEVENIGSKEITLTETKTFCLKASNYLNQREEAFVTVEVSNGRWTVEAEKLETILPVKDVNSEQNHALFSIKNKLYVWAGDSLYESSDGLSFQAVSTIPCEMKAYSISWDDSGFYLFGKDSELKNAVAARYELSKGVWVKRLFPYDIGQEAVLILGEEEFFVAILFEAEQIAIYKKENSPRRTWRLLSILDASSYGALSWTTFEEQIWLGYGEDNRFWIRGTKDGGNWTETYGIEKELGKEMFWILSHKKGLFAVTRDGIYGKRDSEGFKNEAVIPPRLQWKKEALPFVGIFGDKIWFISSNEENRSVWSYSLE